VPAPPHATAPPLGLGAGPTGSDLEALGQYFLEGSMMFLKILPPLATVVAHGSREIVGTGEEHSRVEWV
jgi:hypothetical protein